MSDLKWGGRQELSAGVTIATDVTIKRIQLGNVMGPLGLRSEGRRYPGNKIAAGRPSWPAAIIYLTPIQYHRGGLVNSAAAEG